MGYYIEVPSNTRKAEQLRDLYGGEIVSIPSHFSEVPTGKVLVITVSNGRVKALLG